jgi:hypothetical protein
MEGNCEIFVPFRESVGRILRIQDGTHTTVGRVIIDANGMIFGFSRSDKRRGTEKWGMRRMKATKKEYW